MSATLRGLGLCIDDLTATFGTTFPPALVPGTMVEDDTGHKYMFVYNTGSTDITQYYGAFHTSVTTSGYIASAGLAAGAYAGAAMTAIASGNYGFICIRGFCSAYIAASVATTGWALIGSTGGVGTYTTDGQVQVGEAITTSAGAGVITVKLMMG